MEPEMIEFLKRISKSILVTIVWLGITATAAIKGDNGFIEGEIRLGNIIFYCWFVISTVLLIIAIKRIWKSYEEPPETRL